MTATIQTATQLPIALSGFDGDMSALDALETNHQQNDLKTGETLVHGEENAEQKACEDARQAIERAEEAKAHQGFWSDLENALGDVAEVAGAVAAAATAVASAGAAAAVLVPLAEAASVTAGVGEAAAGGAHGAAKQYEASAVRAMADAQEGTLRAGRMETAVTSTVDDMRDADEAHRQLQQTIQGTIQTHDQTSVQIAASTRIRG